MADTRADRLLKGYKQAKSKKDLWVETYRDAQEYVAPQRETFDEETPGQRKDGGQLVFDSTAQDALDTGVSNLHSTLTPPMKRFFELKAGTAIDNSDEVNASLKNITEVLFSHLHNSNFDTQIVESYYDVFLGTGAILVFEGDQNSAFKFVNVPLSQLCIAEGPHGRVNEAYREFKIRPVNIDKTWPDVRLGRETAEMVNENPEKDICVVECTIPEEIEVFNTQTNQSEIINGFKYYVIEKTTKEIIVERQMRTSPWIIFRWANLPGEIWGRGPALKALPAIKTLNEQVKILLEAASIATQGMFTVADDGIVNIENIDLAGGALIPVTSNGSSVQGPTLAPLPTPGNPNLAQLVIEAQQAQIRRMMFGDPLGDVNLPVKSATEVSLRQQELAKRIGSAFGKLQFELISPLVDRMLDILDNLGLIDLGDFKVDGETIAIEHVSPLAQAQDEEDIIRNVRYVQTLVEMFGPEIAAASVSPERFADELADKLNIDREILTTQEERDQIKAAAVQQLQAQQQGG